MTVKFKDESVSIQFRDGRPSITPGNITPEKYQALVKENENYAALFEVSEESTPKEKPSKVKE